jgi:hypothetical protein
MEDVVKENLDLPWQVAEGDVFDDLTALAQPRQCFLVREAAVRTVASCLPYCDFPVVGRLLVLAIGR